MGYHYDASCILVIAVKDRKASTLTNAWKSLHAKFAKAGAAPNTYVMDNEISSEFIAALEANECNYQLVPPHSHRRNLAERVIQTFKKHFKAGPVIVNPNYLISEWNRLIEQSIITLNLL